MIRVQSQDPGVFLSTLRRALLEETANGWRLRQDGLAGVSPGVAGAAFVWDRQTDGASVVFRLRTEPNELPPTESAYVTAHAGFAALLMHKCSGSFEYLTMSARPKLDEAT